MPKHRQKKKDRKLKQAEKFKEIQKQAKEYFSLGKTVDEMSLYDRVSSHDPKTREMAYITLATLDLSSNKGITEEIFNEQMVEKMVAAFQDPIKKNVLCVFAAVANILTTADLFDNKAVLTMYFEKGLLDLIGEQIREIATQISKDTTSISKSDFEKGVKFIEEAFRLFDSIVSLQGICGDENLEVVSHHETLLEISLNVLLSKEGDYINPTSAWVNESIIYIVSHFLYSLTTDNQELGEKLNNSNEVLEFIQTAIENMDNPNIHIGANLGGLADNLLEYNFDTNSDATQVFESLVVKPLFAVLVEMKSPQEEFDDRFSENLKSITDVFASTNEDEEEIKNEGEPSKVKLTQMFADCLVEMNSEVKRWKNYAAGFINSLEILKELAAVSEEEEKGSMSAGLDTLVQNKVDYVKTIFVNEVERDGVKTTLYDQIVNQLRGIKMSSKVDIDETHEVGKVVNDIQISACEVLINLLILAPEMFDDDQNEGRSTFLLNKIIDFLKNQSYNSKILEGGLRFLALYAKNYPIMIKKVLDEHNAIESFLDLIQTVKSTGMIAHGITIISAVFSKTEQTPEENARICKLLLHHCQGEDLRVIGESLNAIFDIYSDEDYDPVLAELGVIPILEAGITVLENKISRKGKITRGSN